MADVQLRKAPHPAGQAPPRRHRHYESAFEDCLRRRRWPYIRVDEQKRALFAGAKIKSFDFLAYPSGGKGWLIDVKGRLFPYHGRNGRRYWENWVTRDDLEGLRTWEGVFGPEFEAVLVFAYLLRESAERPPPGPVHVFRDQRYVFLSIRAAQYTAYARRRSDSWDTMSMPVAQFRRIVEPVFPQPPAAPQPKNLE